MHTIKSIFILILFVPFLVFAQNQAVLPNAGITPESPFYFFDKFGEALRAFFTFNPEGKARLQITFAAERMAEIKLILDTKGVEAKGLETAQDRLQAQLASAATIVADLKSGGKDVATLADDLANAVEAPKSVLAQTFKEQKRALKAKEKELKARFQAARRAGDTTQKEVLTQELGKIKAQLKLLELKEKDIDDDIETEEERIEEQMEMRAEVEKKIRKAEKEKQEALDEAAEEKLTIPPEAFNAFEHHLSEARSALAAGKFDEAKHHAEEAKENLEKIDDTVDDLGEAKEEERELKEEREEQEGKESEATKKQDEKVRKDAKKEAERLEKDSKKAEEKIREAEERLREAGRKTEEEEREIKNNESEKKQSEESSSAHTPQAIMVFMLSSRFDDSAVDVKRGDTVRWTNKDSQPHWPASNPHPAHTNLSGFDALRPLGTGESYEFTFEQRGVFGYHDHLNPAVAGTVIVK